MINAAVDFSAKRRKTMRRKSLKKREAQFFLFWLVKRKDSKLSKHLSIVLIGFFSWCLCQAALQDNSNSDADVGEGLYLEFNA